MILGGTEHERSHDLRRRADRTDLKERAAFLKEACAGDDKSCRRRVEALLKAHAEPDEILDSPPRNSGTLDYAPLTEKPGSMVGPYKLKEQIGEGGFGVVFVAEQQEPVKRKVASRSSSRAWTPAR